MATTNDTCAHTIVASGAQVPPFSKSISCTECRRPIYTRSEMLGGGSWILAAIEANWSPAPAADSPANTSSSAERRAATAARECRCTCDGWCEQCESQPCAGQPHRRPFASPRRTSKLDRAISALYR
jgi:hypothetical protein